MPPYRKIGWACVFILLLGIIFFYEGAYFPERMSERSLAIARGAVVVVSVVLALMCTLALGILLRDYRRGHLFLLRNISLLLFGLAGVVIIPAILIYEIVTGSYVDPRTLLIIPMALWMLIQNLSWVLIDNVRFLVRMGMADGLEAPLFRISQVTEDERGLKVVIDGGEPIPLLRAFFSAKVWTRLRARLLSLGE
ncbi:MAG: hypothetical protein AAFZ52_02815 [Bacteroidota bacterium]